MIKQIWNISDEERNRILFLHESATKNNYLLSEQNVGVDASTDDQGKVKIKTEVIPLNFLFRSGHWSKNALGPLNDGNTIIKQVQTATEEIKNFASKYLNPQITKVEIQTGESAVTNYDREIKNSPKLEPGVLSQRRADTLRELLSSYIDDLKKTGLLSGNTSFTEQILGGTETEKGPKADAEQFARAKIYMRGVEKSTGCQLQIEIIMEYKKVPKTDPKFHKCDDATFQFYLNMVPIGEENDPDEYFSLNNFKDAGARKQILKVGPGKARQIISKMKNPNDNNEPIIMGLRCVGTGTCHDSPMMITIQNKSGKILSGPSYFGISDEYQDRMGIREFRVVGAINKCGEILSLKDQFAKKVNADQEAEKKREEEEAKKLGQNTEKQK